MINILNNKAFTLLEVIIIIYIFSMGILGLSTLVVKNIQLQNLNKNALIASQLAQEGLEMVRNQRDSNWITGVGWTDDLIGDGTYDIDYSGHIADYADIGVAILKINSNGYYNHTEGENTAFRRIIEAVDNGDNVEIHCVVQWADRGKNYEYQADTLLYNWR